MTPTGKTASRSLAIPQRPVLCLCLLVTLMLVSGCSVSRGYEAALVLADVAAGAGESRLKRSTSAPVRTTVTFPVAGGTRSGDLYLSGKPLAGVLLLPGAAEQGKDDTRLRAFAASLARARFAVLVPDLEGFRSLRVGSRDAGETVDAFSWLVSRKDLAPEGRAGIFSFSYASGPAILAALHPRIAERVRFVMAVGGYYSMVDVLVFFTTGYYRDESGWRHKEPNRYGTWVFVASNAPRLSHPEDRRLFRLAAERKMVDVNAPVDDLAARLRPEGRRLYEFIENRDLSRAVYLINRLPNFIHREIMALDVARQDLTRLKARMIILHGYDDDIIPYTESVALARGIGTEKARLFLVRGLMHVDLKPGLVDSCRLWLAVSALLREREGSSSATSSPYS